MHISVLFAEMQFLLQFLCRDFLAPTHPKSLMRNKRNPDPAEQNLFFGICKLAKGIQPTQKLKTDQTKKNQRIIGSKAAQATTASLCTSHLGTAMRMKTIENFAALWDPSGTADWEAATFAAIDGQQLWVSENWHKVNFGFKSIHYKLGINLALSLVLNLCFFSLCNLEDF